MDQGTLKDLHILVIDDESFMRELVRRMLREMGIGIVSGAKNGLEGLDFLKRAVNPVDIIMLDLEMPVLNGYNFIMKIKNEFVPPLSDTPIVVVSGHGEEDAVRAIQALGVNWFLLKPVSKTDLESRIKSVLKSKTEKT